MEHEYPIKNSVIQNWKQGPLKEKELNPGHGRKVIRMFLYCSKYIDPLYEYLGLRLSNRIIRSWAEII